MITSMEAYPFPSNPSAGNCFRPQQSRSQRSAWWRLRQKLRLLSWTDFFITADLTARWRRHVVRYYSHTPLQLIVTGRYGPTMLVLSVMFAAEINIFFSPSDIVTDVRHTLARGQNAASGTVDYSNYRLRLATGLALIASIVVTFSAILANYTAMGVFSTVSSENAAIVYRSDVGLYAAQLPAVLTVLSFHLFVVCMVLMICVVLGNSALAVVVIVSSILMITYVVVVGSAAARLILATRAMGSTAITTGEVTAELTPSELTTFLLTRADAQRSEALAKQMMFASDDVAP